MNSVTKVLQPGTSKVSYGTRGAKKWLQVEPNMTLLVVQTVQYLKHLFYFIF